MVEMRVDKDLFQKTGCGKEKKESNFRERTEKGMVKFEFEELREKNKEKASKQQLYNL